MTRPLFPSVGEDGKLRDNHLPDRLGEEVLDNLFRMSERPENYGATRDSTSNDRPAIEAAIAVAVSGGRAVLLGGGTYGVSGTLNLPDNLTIISYGATLKQLGSFNSPTVRAGSNSKIIGSLTVETYPGPVTRGVELAGDNFSADTLNVINPVGGAGNGDGWAPGVMIGGSNVTIENLSVAGHQYAVNLIGASHVTVNHLSIKGFIRGIWVRDSKHVRVSGGVISDADPAATDAAGHNGVLIESNSGHEATSDLIFSGLDVSDTGEHGYRMGGQYRISRVRFDNCTARNVGASGFKTLAGAEMTDDMFHEELIFDACVVEDAGQGTANDSAFTVHKAKNVQIISPIVRKDAKTYSCGAGIEIQGSRHVRVSDPIIHDPLLAGVLIFDIRGDVHDVRVDGGSITAMWGLRLDRSRNAVTFSDVVVSGTQITGGGVDVVGSVATLERVKFGASVTGTLSAGDVSTITGDVEWAGVSPGVWAFGSSWKTGDGKLLMYDHNGWSEVGTHATAGVIAYGTFTSLSRDYMPLSYVSPLPTGWSSSATGVRVPPGTYIVSFEMDGATDTLIEVAQGEVFRTPSARVVTFTAQGDIFLRTKPNVADVKGMLTIRPLG